MDALKLQGQLQLLGFKGVVSINADGTPYVFQGPDGMATQDQLDSAISNYNPNFVNPPSSVTIAQARRALAASPGPNNNTLLDMVIAYMDPVPETDDRKILWEYSTTFGRQDPILLQVTTALGMSSAEVDRLFTAASAL